MTKDPDPAEALASIRAARQSVGHNFDYPIRYDMLYGLGCAVMVAAQGLPDPWPLFSIAFALLGVGWSVNWFKKRFGFWINGYSPPRARWVAIGMAILFVPILLGAVYGREQGPWWLCLVMGALAWIVTVVGGRLWLRVWQRELRESDQ